MKTIITREEIAAKVAELGREISREYHGKQLTLVTLLNGAMVFAADLMRRIDGDVRIDTMGIASYSGTESTGELEFRSRLKLPVAGRHVLVIDDIFDTGLTLRKIREYLLAAGALEVRSCVLINKQRQKVAGAPTPDFCAFTIPDLYVVGYGLDADEQYRQLPDIVAPFE